MNEEEFEEEFEYEDLQCSMCGGQVKLLGFLGSRQYFRCINCGIDLWNRSIT